jgi:hypothetical protein
MNSFHAIVRSLDSRNHAQFYEHLCETVELEDKWEVTLENITLTKSFFNVQNATPVYVASMTDEASLKTKFVGSLPAGYYTKPEDLTLAINQVFENSVAARDFVRYPEITLEKEAQTYVLLPGETKEQRPCYLQLPPQLLKLMKFSPTMFTTDVMATMLSSALPIYGSPVHLGDQFFLVTCNVSHYNRCLRPICIPANLSYGSRVTINFKEPCYVPVVINNFSKLGIHILTPEYGDVSLALGPTICALHFRKQ